MHDLPSPMFAELQRGIFEFMTDVKNRKNGLDSVPAEYEQTLLASVSELPSFTRST